MAHPNRINPGPVFYRTDGRCTAYSLACGYIQTETLSHNAKGAVSKVNDGEYECEVAMEIDGYMTSLFREFYDTLGEAYRALDKAPSIVVDYLIQRSLGT